MDGDATAAARRDDTHLLAASHRSHPPFAANARLGIEYDQDATWHAGKNRPSARDAGIAGIAGITASITASIKHNEDRRDTDDDRSLRPDESQASERRDG